MILTGPEIERRVLEGAISIEPFFRQQVNPNSYNLRIAPELYVYENYCLDAKKPQRLIKVPFEDGVSVDLYDKSQKRLARYAATAREQEVEFFTLGGETAYADVSAPEFYEALDYVSHVSTRSDQFSRGYLIDSTGDELTLVCTDKRRICACSVDATRFDSFRIFVDRSVVDATSFLRKEDKIRIKSDGRSLYIVSNSYQVRTTTLCQGFPNYRRLFEEKRTRETELNVDDTFDSVYPMGLVGRNLDRETFKTLYRRILDSNEELIKFRLNIIGGLAWHKKKYPLFLCFENLLDGKSFCHREFLAEWILEKKIANVEEIHDTI